MDPEPQFLVIDYNHDSRFLLVKTLMRKFPAAVIRECDEAAEALDILRADNIAAVVTHRTFDTPGLELVRRLHETSPGVPIIMVSGMERAEAACAAGAAAFLHYDEWLRIGSLVEELLAARHGDTASHYVA